MSMQNPATGTIRAALRYPAFRALLAALAVSQVGDWLYNLALIASSTSAPAPRCGRGSPRRPGWCRSWRSARWAG